MTNAAAPCRTIPSVGPAPALTHERTLVLYDGGLAGRPAHVTLAGAGFGPRRMGWREPAVALLAAVALSGALALAGLLADARVASSASAALDSLPVETVTARQGDSLWSIAQAIHVRGVPTADVVSWIEEANSVDGGELAIGQKLVVPVP